VLEEGHETTASTPVDGHLDEILHMPSESPWPFVLGIVATLGTAFVLTDHYLIAAVAVALAAAVLTLWHAKEPAAA